MEYFDKATKRIATEFASVIKLYRIERDKNNPKGVVTAADLVEKTKKYIERVQQGIFSKQDILTERIGGMMSIVDAIGGADYARKICDCLEEMDDEEAEHDCEEKHFYAANFDRLANDYIKDWVS